MIRMRYYNTPSRVRVAVLSCFCLSSPSLSLPLHWQRHFDLVNNMAVSFFHDIETHEGGAMLIRGDQKAMYQIDFQHQFWCAHTGIVSLPPPCLAPTGKLAMRYLLFLCFTSNTVTHTHWNTNALTQRDEHAVS